MTFELLDRLPQRGFRGVGKHARIPDSLRHVRVLVRHKRQQALLELPDGFYRQVVQVAVEVRLGYNDRMQV